MTCAHCHTTVIPASCGYVHADTHNTQGADGHYAAIATGRTS